MDRKSFWYYVGITVGTLLRVCVYGVGIVGTLWSLWNREIPYLPVMLMFLFNIWTRTIVIYEGIYFLANNPSRVKVDAGEIEKIINIVNYKNFRMGSPN